MNKKALLISTIAAVGLIAAVTAGKALARDVSATTGQARLGSQENCFNYDFTTGAVTSTCLADFIVALTTDTAGPKTTFFTSRATAAGGLCRVVANNRFGTLFTATPFLAIPVNANFVEQLFGPITVPGLGVFFADCITNPGTSINHFDYAP